MEEKPVLSILTRNRTGIITFKMEILKMTKSEKKQWILDYMENPDNKYVFIDVVSEEFVLAYIDACNPNIVNGIYAVPNVPELGRYLSEMHRDGILSRYIHGLTYTKDGFPKWVYVYKLKG